MRYKEFKILALEVTRKICLRIRDVLTVSRPAHEIGFTTW